MLLLGGIVSKANWGIWQLDRASRTLVSRQRLSKLINCLCTMDITLPLVRNYKLP